MATKSPKRKRLIQHVVEGDVLDTRYRKDAEQLEHLLRYTDEQGDVVERWFLDSQLEAVEAPADEQEGA